MPYRLYNHKTKRFLGPPETKAEAWKRLSRMTNRVRDARTAMIRLSVAPAEVRADAIGTLTIKAMTELRECKRYPNCVQRANRA